MSFELQPAAFSQAVADMELGASISLDYRGQDCQLVLWGKLSPEASQPSLKQLHVKVAPYIFKMPSFDSMESLFTSSCFDWGGASSAWQLSANWKLDSEVHPHVYKQLVEELGSESALAKLIQAQLDNPASKAQTAAASKESPSLVAFWKATSKLFVKNLKETLSNVEELVEGREAEAFFPKLGRMISQSLQQLQLLRKQEGLMEATTAYSQELGIFLST